MSKLNQLITKSLKLTKLSHVALFAVAVGVSSGASAESDIIIRSGSSVSSAFEADYRAMQRSNSLASDDHDHSGMEAELEFYKSDDLITSKINELSSKPSSDDPIGELYKSIEGSGKASDSRHILAVLPVKNSVTTSAYGYRNIPNGSRMHKGIDLAAPTGTPIYSTGDGVVTYAGWVNGYGKYIKISHADGYETRYAHCSELDVSVGDKVRQNQVIGKVGSTGRSSGPHLHYEVRKNGEPTNPQVYLAMAEE